MAWTMNTSSWAAPCVADIPVFYSFVLFLIFGGHICKLHPFLRSFFDVRVKVGNKLRFSVGNAVSALVYAGTLITIIFIWNATMTSTVDDVDISGRKFYTLFIRLLGHMAEVHLGLAFLPVAKKAPLFMASFGMPLPHALAIHRHFGRVAVLAETGHFLGWWIQWSRVGIWQANAFADGLTNPTTGYIALLLGDPSVFAAELCMAFTLILGLSALPIVRRRAYSLFYKSHLLLVPCVLGCALYHSWFAGGHLYQYMIPTALIWSIDTFLRVNQSRHTQDAQLQELHGATRITVTVTSATAPQAGTFCFVHAPSLRLFDWHPFTVSQSHPAGCGSPNKNNYEVEFCVRAGSATSWTGKLAALASGSNTGGNSICKLPVQVSGPYGGLAFEPRNYNSILCVAGGSGVTPMMHLIQRLKHDMGLHRSTSKLRRVLLVWVAPRAACFNWFEGVLTDITSTSTSPPSQDDPTAQRLPSFEVRLYATREHNSAARTACDTASEQPWAHTIVRARPDISSTLKELCLCTCGESTQNADEGRDMPLLSVTDRKRGHRKHGAISVSSAGRDVCVWASGPCTLLRQASDAAYGMPGCAAFMEETFEL